MDTIATTDTTPSEEKTNKKRDKVRSAWISFAGRIVAQLVGAFATVSLGVMMLHRYTAPDPLPPAPERIAMSYSEPAASPLQPGQLSVTVILISPASKQAESVDTQAAPPAGLVAQQTEMARAIARAVSGALPPSN